MNEAGAWTDERVELLKKLWSDGLSASQIAAELGSVTRNAVIGKVHRLGLSGRAKSAAAPAAPRNTAPRKAAPRAPSHPMASPAPTHGAVALAPAFEAEAETEMQTAPQAAEDVVIPFSDRVTIMDLREYMCRWPMGDPTTPEFRFCGARSQTGMPYCAHHARIAYQPAADRRRDRSKVRA